MGLPLFVAPVESDLPPKSAAKNRAISPLPAGVQSRRHARQWSRERRAAIVRRIARERMSNGEGSNRLPWIESALPPGEREPVPTPSANTTGATTSQPPARPRRPFANVIRDAGYMRRTFEDAQTEWDSSDYRRDRDQTTDERLALFAAQHDDTLTGLPIEGADLSAFAAALPRQRRARFTEPSPTNAEDASRLRQMIQPERQPTGPDSNWAPSAVRMRRRRFDHDGVAGPTGSRPTRRRTTASRSDINGLGDRDRSLSPEVWNTLLTTLTPDPQPPSVGSSFASAAVSQNTGVSSSTSTTAAPAVVDPACESGHENSDTEAPLRETNFGRLRRRRRRQEDPDDIDEFGRDSDEAPPYRPSLTRAGWSGPPADGPRVFDPYTPISVGPVGASPNATARVVGGRNVFPTPSWEGRPDDAFIIPQLSHQPHGWIGELSVGTSDDEPGTESRRLTQEGSAVSGNATSQGEEDWEGMQRIVRSLARREDIPDEWWAEAGLSRNLP